jgi:hypothetical protein
MIGPETQAECGDLTQVTPNRRGTTILNFFTLEWLNFKFIQAQTMEAREDG